MYFFVYLFNLRSIKLLSYLTGYINARCTG